MKEVKIGKKWIYFGKLKGVSIGISIDQYCIDMSFFKYYIGMEL